MYINAVEELGRTAAEHCHTNAFRMFLSLRHLPYCLASDYYVSVNICKTWASLRSLPGDRCICGECIQCPKCGDFWSSLQTPNAIHSNVGSFEFWPEVYIAKELHKPWYIIKRPTNYAAPMPSDFMPGFYTECMTEQDALHAFDSLVAKYPNIKPWIPLSTLHIAIYMKWNRMARKLADCIERRMDSFTPSCSTRDGDINYPKYIYDCDAAYISRSFTNPCMFMKSCIESAPAETKQELIEYYGYIWSVSSAYWAYLEKESFFNETIRRIFSSVIHINESTQMIITRHWPNIMNRPFDNIIRHTSRTSCRHCKHTALQQPGEPITEYHHVLAYAYRLRQRRFWGVLVCAARLIAKARAVHFVPGIGSAYKLAAAEFSLLSRKTV